MVLFIMVTCCCALAVLVGQVTFPQTRRSKQPIKDFSSNIVKNILILASVSYIAVDCAPLVQPIIVLPNILAAVIWAFYANIMFFITHWCLHSPWLYKHVHLKHHMFIIPDGAAALYMSYMEMWILSIVLVGIPIMLLQPSETTVLGVVVLGVVNSILGHTKKSKFHLQHHKLPTQNYGCDDGLMDMVFSSP